MTIDEILTRFPDARESNGQWSARCPVHEDRRASLSISAGDDGRVLLCCHANCPTSAIVEKLGLKMKDLMPSKNGTPKSSKPRIVKTYNYCDADGTLLFQVCRYEPKDFRQRKPIPGGGWSWSVKNVKRVPYRMPELLAAEKAKTVFIVEGEKDADRLCGLELVATCNAGGAGKWCKEFAQYFQGRQVAILPDNDAPGRKHGQDVASKLHGAAASIKILELPGFPPKGDVFDWLDAGHTISELQSLVDAAPVWQPSPANEIPQIQTDDVLPLTDSGLAERFARRHGGKVRYCHPWGKYLSWDGARWCFDDMGAVNLLAKETARAILAEAATVEEDDARRKLVSFARQSEAAARRKQCYGLHGANCRSPSYPMPWTAIRFY